MAIKETEPKQEKTAQTLPTINLKGKEYVQVKDRILFFNETYPVGKIENSPTFTGNHVLCSTKITPDVALPERYFTGHSYGQVTGEKAFEKLETVACGRALAMMGIGVLESLASADEMQSLHQNAPQPPAYDNYDGLQMAQEEFGDAIQQTPDGKGCTQCNAPMEYKQGISKVGKPYKMWKCTANKDHPVIWVD